MANESLHAPAPVRPIRGYPRRQDGVVLLALILVVLAGSSYLLLSKLNQNAQQYARDTQTQVALRQAKQALIRYAVTYPDLHSSSSRIAGPGYLPCPDQTDDGVGESDCSDDPGSPATTLSTLGRLPVLELGLETLVDGSGERLWYAVSSSFKKNQDATHVLNSETRGTLSVDLEDDIVAVVIAPGTPLTWQTDRNGSVETGTYATGDKVYLPSVAGEYLEDGNATVDENDTSYVTGSTVADSPVQCTDGTLSENDVRAQCFNDVVMKINRRELMAAVEARVANDVRKALAGYRSQSGGAFPWLAGFVDPKVGGRYGAGLGGYGLTGRHSGTTSTTSVKVAYGDFIAAGVTGGDVVWNLTDGSHGTVSSVNTKEIFLSAALEGGDGNNFVAGDVFYVGTAGTVVASNLTGIATVGTPGTEVDLGMDVEEWGVVPGDVLENTVDSTSTTITAVSGATVEIAAEIFVTGETWRVRSAYGIVTDAGDATTLHDTSTDFVAAGVAVGDLVRNFTDGTLGEVSNVTTDTLTVASVHAGGNDSFDVDDEYAVLRVAGENAGQLSVYERGEPYDTDFTVKWSVGSAAKTTSFPSAAAASYESGVDNWIMSSSIHSDDPATSGDYPDALNIADDAECTWAGFAVADCNGKFTDSNFLRATASTVTPIGSKFRITDASTARFYDAGVRSGARIKNLSQPAQGEGVIHAASAGTQNVIDAVAVAGDANPFTPAAGDDIQVLVASRRYPENEGFSAMHFMWPPVANEVCDILFGEDLAQFIGGTIRLVGSGNPVGVITGPGSNADCATFSDLSDGSTTTTTLPWCCEQFTIHYDFVYQRHWQFNVRMAGIGAISSDAGTGLRRRSVCRGFDADCEAEAADEVYAAGSGPVISFVDFAEDGTTERGSASVTPALLNGTTGSLVVSTDFALAADDDEVTDAGFLPHWFLHNRWHEYTYVAYPNALTPTAVAADPDSDCVEDVDCLTVTPWVSVVDPPADRKLVVIVSGAEVGSQDRAESPIALSDYFEDANAVADDEFFSNPMPGDAFNDQLSAAIPCVSPNESSIWPDCP